MQPAHQKLDHLVAFLRSHRKAKHLLFFATCNCVTYFTTLLEAVFKKWKILSLHGKLKNKRQAVFEEFSALKSGVLVRAVSVVFLPPTPISSLIHLVDYKLIFLVKIWALVWVLHFFNFVEFQYWLSFSIFFFKLTSFRIQAFISDDLYLLIIEVLL